MHVYDLMENSTAANSTEVRLTIRDSIKDNLFHFVIEDNGKGTRLEFWFLHDHWDRPPMGDLTGTLVMLVSQHEDIHFIITYVTDEGEFVFDTDEIKEALGGMSMNDLTIIRYLKEMVAENLEEIHANQ